MAGGTKSSGLRLVAQPGFTLLELMIALLILAILTGLALPSYERYMQRGHRADAVRMLIEAAACEERIRTQTGYYDTTRCLNALDGSTYSLRIEPPGETTTTEFTLIAEPISARENDRCGALHLDQSGRRGTAGDARYLAKCWGGR
jgi:type IV pilus assembly protein PilE